MIAGERAAMMAEGDGAGAVGAAAVRRNNDDAAAGAIEVASCSCSLRGWLGWLIEIVLLLLLLLLAPSKRISRNNRTTTTTKVDGKGYTNTRERERAQVVR